MVRVRLSWVGVRVGLRGWVGDGVEGWEEFDGGCRGEKDDGCYKGCGCLVHDCLLWVRVEDTCLNI